MLLVLKTCNLHNCCLCLTCWSTLTTDINIISLAVVISAIKLACKMCVTKLRYWCSGDQDCILFMWQLTQGGTGQLYNVIVFCFGFNTRTSFLDSKWEIPVQTHTRPPSIKHSAPPLMNFCMSILKCFFSQKEV